MIVMKGRGPLNAPLAATFAANLMKRGYLIDQKAWEALCRCSNEDVNRLYHEVMVYLDDMTGGGKKYEPIYKNFPAEVMQMSDVVLRERAISLLVKRKLGSGLDRGEQTVQAGKRKVLDSDAWRRGCVRGHFHETAVGEHLAYPHRLTGR